MGKVMSQAEWREHARDHNKSNSWWLRDARGIECARVCEAPGCEAAVRARYRPEVFGDGRYEDAVEETVEEDG